MLPRLYQLNLWDFSLNSRLCSEVVCSLHIGRECAYHAAVFICESELQHEHRVCRHHICGHVEFVECRPAARCRTYRTVLWLKRYYVCVLAVGVCGGLQPCIEYEAVTVIEVQRDMADVVGEVERRSLYRTQGTL